ncbi:hypothetical protein [Calidifontibacter indicus]
MTGWILFGIALLIALLYAYLASVTRKLAGLRGDDLIDVVVAD